MSGDRIPCLEIQEVTVTYGEGAPVLKDVTLTVHQGEIVALIGPNGAGKSTLLRTISGLLTPQSGTVSFYGRRIDRLPAHAIAEAGVRQVPEGRQLFGDMTVRENLLVGAHVNRDSSAVARQSRELLSRFSVLAPLVNRRAGRVSGGEQEITAIARALMGSPRLLLLDEPSTGLAPKVVLAVTEVIESIVSERVGILLVEQNAKMALSVSHRAYVLERGRIVLEGNSRALVSNARVVAAYLPEAARHS